MSSRRPTLPRFLDPNPMPSLQWTARLVPLRGRFLNLQVVDISMPHHLLREAGKRTKVSLSLIFGFVCDDDEAAQLFSNSYDLNLEWPVHDPMSPSRFPYAFAYVCSIWMDAMSLVLEFWSRVVILIDSSSTPLSAVISQLSWSRDCQLGVTVTSRTFNNSVDSTHESAQIVALMNILHLHMHRIQDLRFNVLFSSSLPSFPIDFHGNATILRRLELKCREDDGGRSSRLVEDFQCPNLVSLIIDGRNYYEACNRDVRWTEKIAPVQNLTISRFKPRLGESLTPYECFLAIDAVAVTPRTLRITDLVLCPTNKFMQGRTFISCLRNYASHLYLEDLHDVEVIQSILMQHDPTSSVSFTRCALGTATDARTSFDWGVLVLAEVSQDLAPFLHHWNGEVLHIRDYPSFDDILLNAMISSSSQYGYPDIAAYTQEFNVHNCPNFSFKKCCDD